MRLLFRLIILTILGFSQTINEQLKELENASPERRVNLMNHIKEQLILMNQQERMQTIHKLRAKLQPATEQRKEQIEDIHHSYNNQIIENHIHIDNTHQEVHSYEEHIIDSVVHKEEHNQQIIQDTNHQEPVTEPTIQNTNHQEPITEPTIQNTNHQEPVTEPTVQNTNHQEPINQPTVQNTEQEQSTIQFNGRGR